MKIFSVPVKTVTLSLLLLLFTSNLFSQIRVQYISHGVTSSTTIPLTLGSAPVNGNTLVAVVSSRGTTSQVVSITQIGATWEKAVAIVGGGGLTRKSVTEIWFAPNVSGAGYNITINLASLQDAAAIVIEYTGILTPSPLDVTASATGTIISASTGITGTTSQSHELWIGGVSLVNSTFELTGITNFFKEVANVSSTNSNPDYNTKVYALERIVDATGNAYSGGSVSNPPSRWTGAIATFKSVTHWTGATNTYWDEETNWSTGIIPTAATDVMIPSVPNLPEINITDAVCNNMTIKSGASLTINEGQALTVNGNLYNLGTLNLNSTSASAIFSLMMNSYSGSGTTNAQLYLTGGGGPNYKWHYIAVPFTSGLPTSDFADAGHNLLAYDNSRVTTGGSDFQGWLWHEVTTEPHSGVAAGGGFSTLDYGKGYNIYYSANTLKTLTGTTIGATLPGVALQYAGSGDNAIRGFNLLGNSLTCSIDFDFVALGSSVSNAVYYTTGNTWVTYIHGAGGANGSGRYIPPLQGFFVKADASTNNTIGFSDVNVKVHSTTSRFKKSATSQENTKEEIVYPKVKLELNGSSTSDETIVWFNDEATIGYDTKFDGYKLFSGADFGQLYSSLEGNNYVINGIPLPADSSIVPLAIKIPQAGNYSILKKVLEELDNYDVYLIDKANGNYTVDLKKSDKYTFSSDAGTFADRFVLKFASLTTSAEAPKATYKNFNIYSTNSYINILPSEEFTGGSYGVVKIYDLTGRIVKQTNNVGLNGGTLVQIPFTRRQGVYIVEITSGLSKYKGKVYVR